MRFNFIFLKVIIFYINSFTYSFVTTARVSHATPAALYAHTSNRYWEDDSKIPVQYRRVCKDITRQLVEGMGRNINVILGGGKRSWLPYIPPERGSNLTHFKKVGRRLDGRNLIFEWMKDKQRRMFPAQYVSTRTEMLNIMQNTEYLLGK